jgi:membrane-associated phospholipid phosphatase
MAETVDTAQSTPSPVSRRRFLGGLGTATVAASTFAPSALLADPDTDAAVTTPVNGDGRLGDCYAKRVAAADRMFAAGEPAHPTNGDEGRYAARVGSYSKGLPHDAKGEVDPDAFDRLVAALESGYPDDFEQIPLGGARKLTNPQCGLAFDTEGNDSHQFVQPPAPRFASAEQAGEIVELAWMALLRDVPFASYEASPLAAAAAAELSGLSDFRGPKANGQVTPRRLFRDRLPGATVGPYLSQLMLLPTPFGAEYVERRMRTLTPGSDHMTSFANYLAVQNGQVPESESFLPGRRYILTGRDLAQWVHIDVLFQAYFNACLILGTPPSSDPLSGGLGCPVNPGNPYRESATQIGFGTWGPPAFKALLCEVATRALKAVWYQKWQVHRRLRPETFAARIHLHRSGQASYDLHSEALASDAFDRLWSAHQSFLLPQTFPEGSPTHPSYGAGHATVAGACVTILKALFDESFEIANPMVPNSGGSALVPYHGPALTVGGELNKLASNVATGRNIAGVHWRSDARESFKLGEKVAIAVLEDHRAGFNEGGSFTFTRFDGTRVTI